MAIKLMPDNIECKLRSIEIYHTNRTEALPGDLIAFNVCNFQKKY
jgi:translation elongation factor EF-1alpha